MRPKSFRRKNRLLNCIANKPTAGGHRRRRPRSTSARRNGRVMTEATPMDDLRYKRQVSLIKQEAAVTITAMAALVLIAALLLALIAAISLHHM